MQNALSKETTKLAVSATREKFASEKYDAVVVGSGPNGLTAAILLLQRGFSVVVVEGQDTAGGGARSAELTLPGYVHDVCSAVHPMGYGSPIFRTLPLEKHGLEWIHPGAPYAHPFESGEAVVVHRSIEETAAQMGIDQGDYVRFMKGLVPGDWDQICEMILAPYKALGHPVPLTRFGLACIQPAKTLVDFTFRGQLAKGTFGGVAAHSALKLTDIASASFGVVLGLAAHAVGWPIPRGGSQSITNALLSYMVSLGGELVLSAPVSSLGDLPDYRLLFFDLTPRQLLKILDGKIPTHYKNQLQSYKYGPAAYKLDYALKGPIPWTAKGCRQAGTVHLGGTFAEIAAAEDGNWHGVHSERPYMLLAQPSLFDDTRAPKGMHTAWTYCHMPNGSRVDMTEYMENQIERFAPGFRDLVVARTVTTPQQMEQKNNNYVGGDINGGALTIEQLFTRPVLRANPYATPIDGVYLCSSSTPPGGAVHGMCGYYAVQVALMGRK